MRHKKGLSAGITPFLSLGWYVFVITTLLFAMSTMLRPRYFRNNRPWAVSDAASFSLHCLDEGLRMSHPFCLKAQGISRPRPDKVPWRSFSKASAAGVNPWVR